MALDDNTEESAAGADAPEGSDAGGGDSTEGIAAAAIINSYTTANRDKTTIDATTLNALAKELAGVYETYARKATLAGADLSSGGTPAELNGAFDCTDSAKTIEKMAQGICKWWSSLNTPGEPAHEGNSVSLVVINGGEIKTNLKKRIQSFVDESTSSISLSQAWTGLFAEIELDVKTIPCTIIELMPPYNTPVSFIENLKF